MDATVKLNPPDGVDYKIVYSPTCFSYRQAEFNRSIGNDYDFSAPVLPIPPPPSGGGPLNTVGDGLKRYVGGGVSAVGRRVEPIIESKPAQKVFAVVLGCVGTVIALNTKYVWVEAFINSIPVGGQLSSGAINAIGCVAGGIAGGLGFPRLL